MREIVLDRGRFPGLPFYAETCPHYLTHSYESPIGSMGKVNPPLRAPSDVEAMWRAVLSGQVDTLGSDHVGRRRQFKQGSIWKASAGFPGLPTTFAVMLTEGYHKRGLPLERVADLCARTPAKIFGLGGRKGDVRVGFDADLVLVDLDVEWTLSVPEIGTWSDYSLYEGQSFRGRPRLTMSRGQVIVDDFQLVGSPGWGRYTPPHAASAPGVVAATI
jgi:dihydropyrimidinase